MDWQEFWLPIEGFPTYEVNNYGEIRNKRNGILLNYRPDKDGYPKACLYNKDTLVKVTKAVHSIAFSAFSIPRPNGYEINHIDLDRTNPAVMNLEYMTRGQNSKHSYDNLPTHRFAKYNQSKKRKINKLDPKSHKIIEVFDSIHAAAHDVCVLPANILRCCKGKLHFIVNGYGWEFVDHPKPRVYSPVNITEDIIPRFKIVKEYSF